MADRTPADGIVWSLTRQQRRFFFLGLASSEATAELARERHETLWSKLTTADNVIKERASLREMENSLAAGRQRGYGTPGDDERVKVFFTFAELRVIGRGLEAFAVEQEQNPNIDNDRRPINPPQEIRALAKEVNDAAGIADRRDHLAAMEKSLLTGVV